MGRAVAAAVAGAGAGGVAALGYYLYTRHYVPPGMGRVSVAVIDADTGAPLAGATVVAGTESRPTGADGRASFTVAPGDYAVSVSLAGYYSDSARTAVTAGKEVVLTFRLRRLPEGAQPGGTLPEAQYCNLKVKVVGWVEFGSDYYTMTKWVKLKGPVGGVKVVAEGPTPDETFTEADGTATFYRLLTGAYTVRVVHDGSTVARQGVSLAKDTEVTVEAPDTVVLGRVRADPTYLDAGGRFAFGFAQVPVPGTLYGDRLPGLLTVSGDLLDDSSVEVFESDDPAVRDIGDPRVVFRYDVHNLRLWYEGYVVAWRWIVACTCGWSRDLWYVSVEDWKVAVGAALDHQRSAVGSGYAASFIGERAGPEFPYGRWEESPLYIRVRGAGRYLHVKVWDRGKTRWTLATIPVAKA